MRLNVKTGDLAVIVAPRLQANLGKIVTVCESLGYTKAGTVVEVRGLRLHCGPKAGHRWVIECSGAPLAARGTNFGMITDNALRPIRDQNDGDETLTWASVPTNQPQGEPA